MRVIRVGVLGVKIGICDDGGSRLLRHDRVDGLVPGEVGGVPDEGGVGRDVEGRECSRVGLLDVGGVQAPADRLWLLWLLWHGGGSLLSGVRRLQRGGE